MLEEFLESISFAYDSVSKFNDNSKPPPALVIEKKNTKKGAAFLVEAPTSKSLSCTLCKQAHLLAFCERFIAMGLTERFKVVKEAKLCVNCFRSNHKTSLCKAKRCKKCDRLHNTLLHREEPVAPSLPKGSEQSNETASTSTKTSSLTTTASKSVITLLPSAVVYVEINSRRIKARLLLDACSEVSLISESFVRSCRIPTQKSFMSVTGINASEMPSNHLASLTIKSRFNDFRLTINANVIPQIPYKLNRKALETSLQSLLPDLPYADSELGHDDIDILLGVEFVNFCLLGEKRFVEKLCLEKSQFGWVVSGVALPKIHEQKKFCNLIVDVESQIRKFWEVEEVEYKPDQALSS